MKKILSLPLFVLDISNVEAKNTPEKFLNEAFNRPLEFGRESPDYSRYMITPTHQGFYEAKRQDKCQLLTQDRLGVLLKCYYDFGDSYSETPHYEFYFIHHKIDFWDDILKYCGSRDCSDINQRMACAILSCSFSKENFDKNKKSYISGYPFLGAYYDCPEVPISEIKNYSSPDCYDEFVKRGWDKFLEDDTPPSKRE